VSRRLSLLESLPFVQVLLVAFVFYPVELELALVDSKIHRDF